MTHLLKQLSFTVLLLPGLMASARVDTDGFRNPPPEARPRVWWHWEDGNVSKDGIRKDLEWMHSIGIGGYHHFDAGMSQKPVVEKRMIYMHEDWKDAFRYAIRLSDSLGMTVGIASSPGWSNTGGPWVSKDDAMKRLVWSSVDVDGGPVTNVRLGQPYTKEGWYRDIAVLAVRLPQTGEGFRSVTVLSPDKRRNWNTYPYKTDMRLECSDDGENYRTVKMIPPSSAPSITVNFPETTAAFFRVVRKNGDILPQSGYVLHRSTRVEHAEEKAAFSSPYDLASFRTVMPEDERCASVQDVLDISTFMRPDGTLDWTAPQGKWRIIRFGCTLTGKKNGPAPKEATGLEVDKLDKTAYRNYFIHYLNMYKEASGGMLGSRGITELLVDSYEAWWQTWTPLMMQEFELKRGYSLLQWMPVLTGEILNSAEASERFLFDWRRTIADLYYENYAQVKDIAAQFGIGNVYLESQENGRVFVADGMDIKRHSTVPMAACWTNKTRSSRPVYAADMRESASVAHLYGQRWVAAESFTTNGLDGDALLDNPRRLKRLADSEFACGVNRIFIHESSHQPLDDCRPGLGLGKYGQWFSRHETWALQAGAWTDYLARTSYMLSQGSNVADILVYYGEDLNVTAKYARKPFGVPPGYNYDFVNARALEDLKVADGRIVAPSGASYSLLCLDTDGRPESDRAVGNLARLRAAGAAVCDVKDLTAALKNIRRDVFCPDAVRFVHRTTSDTDIYWLDNHSDSSVRADITLRCTGKRRTVSLWNPEDGTVRRVKSRMENGCTVVPVQMDPDDAFFLVCGDGKAGGGKASVAGIVRREAAPDARHLELSRWTLEFPEKTVQTDSLHSYTSFGDRYLKYFSGICRYSTEFSLDRKPREAVLNLGQVCDLCELTVNGHHLGVMWRPPFRTEIGQFLQKGQNTIEVKVVNSWVNRLIGDAQPEGLHGKGTYTTTRFYKADSPLQNAGLLGPVTLRWK